VLGCDNSTGLGGMEGKFSVSSKSRVGLVDIVDLNSKAEELLGMLRLGDNGEELPDCHWYLLLRGSGLSSKKS